MDKFMIEVKGENTFTLHNKCKIPVLMKPTNCFVEGNPIEIVVGDKLGCLRYRNRLVDICPSSFKNVYQPEASIVIVQGPYKDFSKMIDSFVIEEVVFQDAGFKFYLDVTANSNPDMNYVNRFGEADSRELVYGSLDEIYQLIQERKNDA